MNYEIRKNTVNPRIQTSDDSLTNLMCSQIKSIQFALTMALILLGNCAWSQKDNSTEARYNNAKELMNLGKYGLAMQAFKPLTSPFEGNHYEKISSLLLEYRLILNAGIVLRTAELSFINL